MRVSGVFGPTCLSPNFEFWIFPSFEVKTQSALFSHRLSQKGGKPSDMSKNDSYSRNSFQQQLLKQLLKVEILSSTFTRLSGRADQQDCKNKPQKHKSLDTKKLRCCRPALFYLFKSVSSVSPSPLWCIEMNEQALTQQVCLNVYWVTSPLKQIFWHVTVGKASV